MNRDYVPIALLAAIVLAMVGWSTMHQGARPKASSDTPAPVPAVNRDVVRRDSFPPQDVQKFLADAMAAEAMADPLQRCLSYPDPPDSHWSRAAVEAYCRYRTQPFLDGVHARDLIAKGHADELDRQLAEALRRQVSEPGSRGLLDHIYLNDFDDGSPELRALLDAWKRQSPKSAFAYAASGVAYVNAAGNARGSNWISETPTSSIEEMERLLVLAKADLATAERLDPAVTPTYPAMVSATRLSGSDDEADHAAKAGLKASPFDYSLLTQLMVSAQPKWGGSMDAMRDVAAQAQAGAKENPLLELLVPEPEAYAEGICGCGGATPHTRTAYTEVLDQVAATATLSFAGGNAYRNGQFEFGLVYVSEALRFKPEMQGDRAERLDIIATLGARPGMRDLANRALEAEADRIMAQAPTDSWVLERVGDNYVQLAQWEKAWRVSEQLVGSHPENADSWILRAMIQKGQPRPGLHDTATYIVTHFANDPDSRDAVAQARLDLASEGSTQGSPR